MPDDRLPKNLLSSLGSAPPQAALGLLSLMLQCVVVNCVAQVNLTRMLRTDSTDKTCLART